MSPSRPGVLAALLAIATFAVYAQVATFGFVDYDDPIYVTANEQVLAGLTPKGVVWAFTEPGYNWYPLTWLSHMLDVELFGAWAGGHHLTNALLHALNTALLFGVLASATGAPRRSALVAALFALHPLHVETVAWVAGRKDILSTGFALLATWAYLGYARRPALASYALVLGLFACALMAKSMMVTLPCVFLLLDHWPIERRPSWRLVVEKLPLLGLSVGAGLLAVATQDAGGAMVDAAGIPFPARVANAVVTYAAYLGDALWPVGLSILRPHPELPQTGGVPLGAWEIAAAAGLGIGLCVAVFVSRRRYLQVGWLWYVGTLLPVIGLIQVGVAGRADRYTYWPLVGIFIACVWGVAEIAARRGVAGRYRTAVACALVAVCAVATVQQSRHWRGSVSLFERVVAVHPSPMAHVGLGRIRARAGDAPAAEASYRAALALDPASIEAHSNLGRVLLASGHGEAGVAHLREALRSNPANVEARVNLAGALASLGDADAAIAELRAAARLAPEVAEVHYNLGNLLLAAGQSKEAIEALREAVRLAPDFARAHFNLGYALGSVGDLDGAIHHYRAALDREPDYAKAEMALERTLAAKATTGG